MFQQNIALGPGTEVFSSHLLEVVIMLLGAAILGFVIGWLFKKSYKEEFFALKTDHDKCPGIKTGLENTISQLDSHLSNCKADLEKARVSISDLTSEKEGLMVDLNERISSLGIANASIEKLEHEIKTIREQAGSLQAALDKSNHSIKEIKGENAKLSDQVKQHKEELVRAGVKSAAGVPIAFAPEMRLEGEVFGKKYKADDLKSVEDSRPNTPEKHD